MNWNPADLPLKMEKHIEMILLFSFYLTHYYYWYKRFDFKIPISNFLWWEYNFSEEIIERGLSWLAAKRIGP
jgi:hypothetical protein